MSTKTETIVHYITHKVYHLSHVLDSTKKQWKSPKKNVNCRSKTSNKNKINSKITTAWVVKILELKNFSRSSNNSETELTSIVSFSWKNSRNVSIKSHLKKTRIKSKNMKTISMLTLSNRKWVFWWNPAVIWSKN